MKQVFPASKPNGSCGLFTHIFSAATWRKHCSKSEYLYMYILDHTCIYIYMEQPWKNMKTYKCEDPYHCSTMRSSPETCGTFQQWRTTTMAAWQLRGRHFPSGGIFSSMVQFLLPSFTSSCGGRRQKKHLLHQKPEIVQFASICFIGLPIDFPIPLLNKFIDWKSYLPSVISPRKS